MGPRWLSGIITSHTATGAEMVVGPVVFSGERSFFEKMQSLEFMALIAATGGSLFFGKALMCNGANLAYTRRAYEAVGGSMGGDKASGDDVLLMYAISKKFGGKVVFLKDENAIVRTMPQRRLSDFLSQRRRWASKGFSAMSRPAKVTAGIVYFFNFFLLAGFLGGAICYQHATVCHVLTRFCLILIGFKCLIDFLLLFLSASFFGKRRLLLFFLPEQLLYIVYVVLTGLLGSFGKFEWKGRKTN
jgi:cellulose synthase/poly-beta-1,6-N-acetylglucosamine synthase-like glycosyltransferase